MVSFLGPRIPRFFVPDSPEQSSSSKSSQELFPEDKSSVSDSSEGESTLEYAAKVTTKRRKFFFKNPAKKQQGSQLALCRAVPIFFVL